MGMRQSVIDKTKPQLNPTQLMAESARQTRARQMEKIEKFRKAALSKKPIVITTQSGLVMHMIPNRAIGWMEGRRTVATARNMGQRCWLLRFEGHQWEITPDMPAYRFQRIPGAKGSMLTTVVKGFPSWQACAKEVELIRKNLLQS